MRLMGLIHIANEIQQVRPLPADHDTAAKLDRRPPRNRSRARVRPVHVGRGQRGHRLAREVNAAVAPPRRAAATRSARQACAREARRRRSGGGADIDVPRATGGATAGYPATSIQSISPTVGQSFSASIARSPTACGRWRDHSPLSDKQLSHRQCRCSSNSNFPVHALRRDARTLAARWPPGVRAEGRGKRTAAPRGIDTDRLSRCTSS